MHILCECVCVCGSTVEAVPPVAVCHHLHTFSPPPFFPPPFTTLCAYSSSNTNTLVSRAPLRRPIVPWYKSWYQCVGGCVGVHVCMYVPRAGYFRGPKVLPACSDTMRAMHS